ncbi:MAG TPA: hypothetical protein VJ962_00885 [Clostridia bacterium]|nr:hypothetical protein [Clostridia bacterium]
MNAIYSFKNKIRPLINNKASKVWLSEKQGRRIECLFTIGSEQFVDSTIIYEDKKYVLRGQNISKAVEAKIIDEVKFNE